MIETCIFILTYKCNANCIFCLNNKNDNEMDTKKIKICLLRLREQGVRNIVFSGGEPLIRKDFLEIIEFAFKLGFKISIQTNGYFINDKLVEELRDKIESIEVSLEGFEKEHKLLRCADFFKVVSGIKKLKGKIYTITNFTLTKKNYLIIERYLRLLEHLGVNQANITMLYKSGKGKKNYDSLKLSDREMKWFFDKLEEIECKTKICIQSPLTPSLFTEKSKLCNGSCEGGKTEFCLKPDGKITMCPCSPFVLGDIFTDKIEDIFKKFDFSKNDKCQFLA